MKDISGRFRFLLSCLIALGLAVGQLFGVSAVAAQSTAVAHPYAPSLLALIQEGEGSCLQPPTNVNLSTLSDAQLALYGFPAHTAMNQDRARWEGALAHARHRICGSSTATSAQQRVNGPADGQIANVVASKRFGFHWAGDSAYSSRNTFNDVSDTFYVPALQPSLYGTASVSFWVGLGGDPQSAGTAWQLVQAGIDLSITSGGVQSGSAFWEAVSASHDTFAQPLGFSVRVRDYIYSEAASYSGSGGYDLYLVEDETTGVYNSYTPGSPISDGATAECMAEVNSATLADFGTETLNRCYIGYHSSTYATINNLNHYYWIPTSNGISSGTARITAGPISSAGTFNVVWNG